METAQAIAIPTRKIPTNQFILIKLQRLEDLGHLRDVDLIEPGEGEQDVLGRVPTGDDVTLESGIHRLQERLLKVITVGEPVVLVTEVVEVLHRGVLHLVQADGVVDAIGVDDSSRYQEVSLFISGELLDPDVL